jgi:hypothetical protein
VALPDDRSPQWTGAAVVIGVFGFVAMVVAVAGVPANVLARLIFGPPQEET